MAMIVAFCLARMTKLVQMKVSEIVQEQHSITLQTQRSEGKKIIKNIITFNKRIGRCCPDKPLLLWTAQREKYSIMYDKIWHNLSKKAPAPPQYCSYQLTNITRSAGIQSPYAGPTIRHSMMTHLRVAGATQPEVNAFSRHAISSNVVDKVQNCTHPNNKSCSGNLNSRYLCQLEHNKQPFSLKNKLVVIQICAIIDNYFLVAFPNKMLLCKLQQNLAQRLMLHASLIQARIALEQILQHERQIVQCMY
ncbi:MAG: hypothetical protein EZS28_016368 [Streblomastix strix]|uniref:Tyr recombinase domain-containing protein n=1 Tax=Streblomastix strix TaxID=222440 RepID=A0A5J4W0F9_9EUKA|nr:MAG: hypothetical protein EZS28_016368 [Streblomastix strix]